MNPYILQKILHHTHHKPLHPLKNIHTKILLHTPLHRIPSRAWHAPLYTHTIIQTTLFTHRPFTFNCTRKNCHNIHKNLPRLHQILHKHVRLLDGVTGVLPQLSHWYVPLIFQSVLILYFKRKDLPSKTSAIKKGIFPIYCLRILLIVLEFGLSDLNIVTISRPL